MEILENIPKEKLDYIKKELKNKGKDIREIKVRKVPKLEKITTFNEVKIGQQLVGTVRNVTDFGAFVDIGLTNAGLVHISNLSEKFVEDIHEFIIVGDIVDVYVIDKNDKKEQISLSLIPGREKYSEK